MRRQKHMSSSIIFEPFAFWAQFATFLRRYSYYFFILGTAPPYPHYLQVPGTARAVFSFSCESFNNSLKNLFERI